MFPDMWEITLTWVAKQLWNKCQNHFKHTKIESNIIEQLTDWKPQSNLRYRFYYKSLYIIIANSYNLSITSINNGYQVLLYIINKKGEGMTILTTQLYIILSLYNFFMIKQFLQVTMWQTCGWRERHRHCSRQHYEWDPW